MILILPAQEGSLDTNCLSMTGMENAKTIADKCRSFDNLYIYSCRPDVKSEDMTPVQTASILGSLLNKSVKLIKCLEDYPPNYDGFNHIIIWNKNEIPEVLSYYFHNHFTWDVNDYQSAIEINNQSWKLQENFV